MRDTKFDIHFSTGFCDNEGDEFVSGIQLHFGKSFIVPLDNIDQLDEMIEQLSKITNELKENWGYKNKSQEGSLDD